MRVGEWKLRLVDDPQLFNLQVDPSERYNRIDEKPEIVKKIREKMYQAAKETGVKVAIDAE